MPRLAPLAFLGLYAIAAACLPATPAQAADNLLTNSGFESPLAPHWEKRTPEDETRTLRRVDEAGRNDSAAAVLENLQPSYTRLRQGADRSIEIQPGSLIELSAWVRGDMTDDARITLQIYCLDADGGILAQPRSPAMSGTFDWTRASAWTVVPQDTAYTMAYLQVQEGVGKVTFDDVELVVRQEPVPLPPAPKVALFTDLPDDSPCLANLKTLFEDGLVQVAIDAPSAIADIEGILVLFEGEKVPTTVCLTANAFAQSGGHVFMDIRNFAQWQAAQAVQVNVGTVEKASVETRMQAGLHITPSPVSAANEGEGWGGGIESSDDANLESHSPRKPNDQRSEGEGRGGAEPSAGPHPTAGFQANQIMPRASFPDGNLWALSKDFKRPGLQVLALTPDGHPGIVQLKVGKGTVVAADVLSLREPYCRNIDAYYKYAPITNTLTNAVPFGHYFPRKFKYAEFVNQMKAVADASPKIRFEEEGPACDGQPICSLNLGTPGKPLYFLYAAAHGSEWEPGYGLLCFAEQLADERYSDVVDLDEVEVKIIPLLNPSGYDAMRRQNGNGVDLNRQGDHQWERFQGRDSNEDGTWAPFDYDWKGSAPFSEPEAQVYRKIAEQENLYCVLDFHGNSSATSNKLAVLPATALPDNGIRAMHLQQIANARLRGRHLLRQNPEEHSKQYLLERVQQGGGTPFLMNTSAKDRYGVLIELTAGYPSSYGTVLQTDVTCELCRALFEAYPPGE